MNHDEIQKFIAERGYRSKSEILQEFSGTEKELIDTNLQFLIGKNQVRKLKFASGEKTEELFYIPG